MSKKLAGYGLLCSIILLLTLLICVGTGPVSLPIGQIARILLRQIPILGQGISIDWSPSSEQIVLNVRLPRIVLGMLVGASLALAGAAFQGVLRNPLADPFTLGVSSGSSLGAAVLIFFGWQYSLIGALTLPAVAFFSGVITLWIVLWLAKEKGKIPTESLILSGVVMQSFLGAVVAFLTAMSKKTINEILYWTLGSLSLRGWSYTAILFPYVIVGLVVLWSYARRLNLLALGEREASHSGLDVERTKFIVLVVATLLTATAVSVSGVIGFVGLVVPHMIRMVTGPDYRLIVPLSAICGGIFMMWSDLAARMVLAPTEIPLGIITAFLGAPFFAYLLCRNKKQRMGVNS
ncbi:iron complex transport system permease protein [Paenibacillus shirakamiensis]|uniref:Iron complex transport system permease protein n=1 Tax=Paenibacillus shirakamiensis TaxID=1265935 RepID=A0ABS4JHK4_9BACL|nr:iron chelate uptake ABC transporter family permease subunit [Paenibacillus shirakamiensis]MBP2000530.1 iron complex transport system permease protein [Paenibacillus shirakamiensis]